MQGQHSSEPVGCWHISSFGQGFTGMSGQNDAHIDHASPFYGYGANFSFSPFGFWPQEGDTLVQDIQDRIEQPLARPSQGSLLQRRLHLFHQLHQLPTCDTASS